MTSNLGQQELRELRLTNERKEMQEKSALSESAQSNSQGGSGKGSARGSGKGRGGEGAEGAEVRVGEDEVDEALMLRDQSYEALKNEIMQSVPESANEIDGESEENKSSEKKEKSEEVINDMTLELVNKYFSLEFVNRIDEVIMFNPLGMESVRSICAVQISKVKSLLVGRGMFFYFSSN